MSRIRLVDRHNRCALENGRVDLHNKTRQSNDNNKIVKVDFRRQAALALAA